MNRLDAHSTPKIRKHIVLTGVLQGIGCRPTVYRLATRLGLGGWVVNSTSGVHIEIEGTPEQCRAFNIELPSAIPFPGRIDHTEMQDIDPLGEVGFRINASLREKRSVTPIPPDVAVCDACLTELLDSSNPRYLYPFITCTLCGPRFTVVRSFPYDRERTSMADFSMCPRCAREYETPDDRRFHSQTNSCPDCGPRLALWDVDGSPLPGDPVIETIRLLRQGKILAIKGIGGFHLACDALNPEAVQLLRDRKGRMEKPFAVMMPDVETVRQYCVVSREEDELLCSPVAPIVLLEAGSRSLAWNVAPFVGTTGVMLPYAPLHHLLFRHPAWAVEDRLVALVMTSGNRSEEPIVRGNAEAMDRLRDLADAFLMHDREIVLRADDSIFRLISGRATVFRRSRGMVPAAFKRIESESTGPGDNQRAVEGQAHEVGKTEPVILATGGDIKNCLAVLTGDQVVPGAHVGDLGTPVAQDYFRQSIDVLTGYLEVDPDAVALDPHPGYFSNSLGRESALPIVEVYHHHGHAVSLLAQHRTRGPALFAVFDGTGFGPDGTIWGGEFLVADAVSFTRMGHIGLFHLPGAEAAIREPARILAGLLDKGRGIPAEFIPMLGEYAERASLWLEAVRKGLNSPVTSSAGRLFDAVAAAVGFRNPVTFEGQAAMWLEATADKSEKGQYPLDYLDDDHLVIDPAALTRHACKDLLAGSEPATVAARFHCSMAGLIGEIVGRLSERTGIRTVGLTGGCFQNKLLTELTLERLQRMGFEVLLHESVPPNDGGLAIGQAVSAAALLA